MLRVFRSISRHLKPKVEHARCYSIELQSKTTSLLENNEKRRKMIELEVDIMRQEGRKVPSALSSIEMERLLELPSVSARRRYLTFLFLCEMTTLNLKKKKEQKQIEREQRLAELREKEKEMHIVYGLGRNSMFLKIYETTMNLWHNNKLTRAMQFSQKLVIDCSYDEYMTFRESDNCAKQLVYAFATNRLHDQPFDLHFCNLDTQNSKSGKKLLNAIPTMYNPDFPMNVHKESYTDIFDKEKLVYLTPHCKNELIEYNHDDIYIVGAMVDKAHNDPLSLAKAKRLGLRMAKLPLDKFLDWGIGGKSLTINQMIEIMLDMRATNDWNEALKHVPRRKLFNESLNQTHKIKIKQPIYQAPKGRVVISKDFFSEETDQRHRSKERKHFEKYFDINTWGKKNSNE